MRNLQWPNLVWKGLGVLGAGGAGPGEVAQGAFYAAHKKCWKRMAPKQISVSSQRADRPQLTERMISYMETNDQVIRLRQLRLSDCPEDQRHTCREMLEESLAERIEIGAQAVEGVASGTLLPPEEWEKLQYFGGLPPFATSFIEDQARRNRPQDAPLDMPDDADSAG